MMANELAIQIRTKKLGVLLRDARLAAGKTMKECGEAIGVSSGTISSFEHGNKAPSLPEIEILAYFFDVPVDHFWGKESISAQQEERVEDSQLDRLIPLRQRILGVMLRKARLDADLSMKDLGEIVGVTSHRIKTYEIGERPIPLPELELMAGHLNLAIGEFQDKEGPVGRWVKKQAAIESFLQLSPELQQFVAKPINAPYLEVAQRLSEMSVDKLRAVAEGLLEITL